MLPNKPHRFFVWVDPATVAVFAVACLILGGSSRPDALSAFALRPIAVLCLTVLAMRHGSSRLASVRVPLWTLAAFSATIAIQLVPLPSSIWANLQSRAPYEAGLNSLGLGGQAHPLSLSPDQTWNSLIALVIPLTMLIGYAALRPELRAAMLPALIFGQMASAVLAVIQAGSGIDSVPYLYGYSASPPGLFANRNHQAVFLALIFPALRAWTLQAPVLLEGAVARVASSRAHYSPAPRLLIALGIGLFMIPMILVTGSRAGFSLMLVGLIGAWAIAPPRGLRLRNTREWLIGLTGFAAVALVVGAVIKSGRLFALQRILDTHDVTSDLRVAYLPTIFGIVHRFWVFGTGFGTFDPVLRGSEPDQLLRESYFNNAHNDLIELVLTGGVASTLVLIVFLIWWGYSAFAAFKAPPTGNIYRARAAGVMIAMLLLASLVDYPLRTPLMDAVLALLCAWLYRPLAEEQGLVVASAKR